jgi:2-dehydropantoate 2-reductase
MRIAVIGLGAVGGYFGGRLAQAGHDVIFLSRGAALDALRAQGLTIKSIAGDFQIQRPNTAADANEIGPVDVVLVAVKAPQVTEVAPTLRPLVGPHTTVIPLQNGLEAPRLLAAALGAEHVLNGLCKIFALKTGPAAIEHKGLEPAIEFGELNGEKTERVERIRAAFESAKGMTAVVPDDIEAALWQKLLFVEPLGAVGAVTRQPAGVLRAVPEARRLLQTAMEEVVAVAHKRGVALDPTLPEQAIQRLDTLPADATSSMHRDILAGRPSEFEFQVGTLVRYAAEAEVPVPVHSTIYAALKPGELKARGELK